MFKNQKVKAHIIFVHGMFGSTIRFKDKGAALRFMSTMKDYHALCEYRTGFSLKGMMTSKAYIEAYLLLRKQQALREANNESEYIEYTPVFAQKDLLNVA